jgi:hypothetical protein
MEAKSDFGRTRQMITYAEYEPALNVQLFLRRVDALDWLVDLA